MNDRSGQSLGTYRLVRLLGKGGFAEVYLGQHIHLNTQTAIKILLATRLADEAEIDNFRREAQIIANFTHANIVRVLDFNIEQGIPFFVMEYAAQGSLRTKHPRGSQLPLPTVTAYVRQVAAALHYAHQHKQIHRDVKPENILVRDDGSLMLSDFGIATVAHTSVSQSTEDMIGTVAYMAPEQAAGHPHFASDQYALAVTAYEWLVGRQPFHGTLIEIAMQHATTTLPSLITQLPNLSPAVEQVIFKALAKEPAERFATIQEFALALVQAEKGIYNPATFPDPLVQQAKPEEEAARPLVRAKVAQQAPQEPEVQHSPRTKTPSPQVAQQAPARQRPQNPLAQAMQVDLDQLWYTWSKNGLDTMAMGYRVRAASGELRNTQSMRYRVLDRFLRYNPPPGINIHEFDARIAPISYAFISNGPENLLIRKVFKGRDLAGRNAVFFTHLIAGLPDEFTVRDAIRLWDCMDVWVESEENQAPNDTLLNPLPYTTLKHHADHAQAPLSLPFAAIRARLEELLLTILCQNGLAQKVYLVGRANLAAALLYGLTHCLPLSMFGGNFTFTTYESTANEIEATFVTTVTGTELADPTYLDVHINNSPPVSPTDRQKYKSYVDVAIHYLVSGNVDAFLGFIKKIEAHNCQSSDQLMEEFYLAFGQGPLTVRQIEDIITNAGAYTAKLRDPQFQQQSALVLLEQMDYWQQQGKKTFQQLVKWLGPGEAIQADPTRQALAAYLNGLAPSITRALREGLSRVKTLEPQGAEIAWTIPNHCGEILMILLPPVHNEQLWLSLINDFAQPPLYTTIKSDSFWSFQVWLLTRAGQLPQPQRFLSQVQPWLDIPTWDKLKEFLALDLPVEWIYAAIHRRIHSVPKSALPLIQKYEPLFIATLQQLLQQGDRANVNLACAFFQRMVEYGYPNRVSFLLALVNTYYEAGFVQTIFACAGIATPYRLQEQEISATLAGCRQEVIATCNRTQALADYLQEFILTLTPAKLSTGKNKELLAQLKQLSAGPGLPPLIPTDVINLVSHWQMINTFVNAPALDRHLLAKTETAIRHIRHGGSTHTLQLGQTFADEFIPTLVKQASTESDLDMIQDILGTSMTSSRWDLLRWMALLAGQTKTQLYELFPYIACGMREAELSGQTARDLDTYYLQPLFSMQNKEMLTNIDTMVNYNIWPAPLRQKWESWRSGGKKGFSIPFAKNNAGRLQEGPQPLVLPGSNDPAPAPLKLPRATPNMPVVTPVPGWPEPAPMPQPAKVVALLPTPNRSISYEEYARFHQTMPSLLDYWLSKHIPENQGNSKLINFEIRTLQQIKEDLHTNLTQISRNLLTYLVDDALIEEVIHSKSVSGIILTQEFDPERYLHRALADFFTFTHQGKRANEAPYKDGLCVLIRRYLVINELDQHPKSLTDVFGRRGLHAFLEKERTRVLFSI